MINSRLQKLPFKTHLTNHSLTAMEDGMNIVLEQMIPGYAENPSTKDTAARFVKYLAEYCQPLNIEELLGTPFDITEHTGGLVIQTGIPFRMACEHHLLPATGKAAIGYIPRTQVVGLSKLCRLVDAVGVSAPSLQEHIGSEIANLLQSYLDPLGVIVAIQSEHSCMACRGVAKPDVQTFTLHTTGCYRRDEIAGEYINEFLQIIKGTF